jgi:hypothetical protein
MKRQMYLATAFSAALGVSLAAQTGTAPGAQAQEKQSSQQVTMTGCLEHAKSGVAGTTGTPAGASASEEFVLSNASPSTGASGAPGTAGTAGAAGAASSSMGNKYRLVGGDKEDLQKYLNSQVEIRGTLDKSSAMGAAPAAPGEPASEKLATLRVTSIKQIASTCASGK